MKRVVLIDGKNQVFRMNAVMGNLSRGDGFPTGAIFGCLNSVIHISRRMPDASFVWVWDGDGETWRHKYMRENAYLYTKDASTWEPAIRQKVVGYKANRQHKEEKHKSKYPQDGHARGLIQIPVLKLILEGSGFRNYQVQGLEGDDLIALLTRYLLKHTDAEVIIHSGDKDFYQLMSDRVRILSRIEKGKLKFQHRKDVEKKFGVSVKDWAKFRAWTGDPMDNIPHISGISLKVARKILDSGLDPSLNLRDVSDHVAKKFTRYFEPDGITQAWPFIQANYGLCRLVSSRKDSRLSEKIQKQVKHLLRHIKFTRDRSKLNSDNYRRISFLLMQYDLRSILAQRDILWRIP